MEQTNNKIVPVILTLIVLCVVVLGYFYFFKGMNPFKNESDKQAYLEDVDTALSSHSDKNFDESITEFESLLQNAPDTATAALVKAKLGVNLVSKGLKNTGTGDPDVKRGMDMLWSVALDRSLHDRIRATTFSDLGSIYQSMNNEFYIASTPYPPFNTFITDKERNDPTAKFRAALKIFEYSDETYANPYAKFNIVFMYTSLLAENKLPVGITQKEAAILIQKYIEEGDAALATDPEYGEGTTALMLLYRAKGFGLAASTLNNKTKEQREDAFKKVLEYTQSSSKNNKYVSDVDMETRFWYASFLINNYGDQRLADVQSIVAPYKPGVTEPGAFTSTRGMFVGWRNAPYENFGQKRAVLVAGKAPDFKEFLKSVGWNL